MFKEREEGEKKGEKEREKERKRERESMFLESSCPREERQRREGVYQIPDGSE